MLGSSEEEKTPRRAARQRARRSSAPTEEKVLRKTACRKDRTNNEKGKAIPEGREEVKSTRAVARDDVVGEERKAPTPFSNAKAKQRRLRKRNIVLAAVMVIGIGSSAAVGLTDSGQINVNETIEARNERIRNNSATTDDESTGVIEIPVQNTANSLPNGGLVGAGKPKVPIAPPVEIASSTASSSNAVATSTDEVIEEDVTNGDEVEEDEEMVEPEE